MVIRVQEAKGTVKTEILSFVYDFGREIDSYEVVSHIKDWSASHLERPIANNSGIYRHLKELAKLRLIINDEDKGMCAPIPTDFSLFQRLCSYLVKEKCFTRFTETEYFQTTLKKLLPKLLFEGEVKFGVIEGVEYHLNGILDILKISPTAAQYLILEPQRLYEFEYYLPRYSSMMKADVNLNAALLASQQTDKLVSEGKDKERRP